jgi:hypothetical protein
VKDLATGRVYISSQNHGYVVDTEKLDRSIAIPAFCNVNDGTNEGLAYVGKNVFTVQFHPEACPGPQDSGYLFDRFLEMMDKAKAGEKVDAAALYGKQEASSEKNTKPAVNGEAADMSNMTKNEGEVR